ITFPSLVTTPQTTDSVTRSATVGLIVSLTHGWGSEIDYTWSESSFEDAYQNLDSAGFAAALAAGTVNPFADTIANPLNLTPYLAPTTYSGNSSLNDVSFRASG